MSNVYTDPGYEDLYCLLGSHTWVDGRCKYCQRRNRATDSAPTATMNANMPRAWND